MKEIAKNKYYTISVDEAKNRMYFTPVGFWEKPEEVKDFLSDMRKAISSLTPGFTLLTNATQFKVPSSEVGQVLVEAQQALGRGGLKKLAEVLDAGLVKMAADRWVKESGLKKSAFADATEAEAWLNQ